MITSRKDFTRQFLVQSRHSLQAQHLPRIVRCLDSLSARQIWWRSHPTSNSAGNLVLHLAGNVRQWIVAGLGGQPDRRERDKEFSELGPMPRRDLTALLQKTVAQAVRVLDGLSHNDLEREYQIQGFRVDGLTAIAHVTEHFAYHTGQIIYITKMLRGMDLGFTHLPGEKSRKPASRRLSQH